MTRLASFSAATLVALVSAAQTPTTVSHSGFLLDGTDAPLTAQGVEFGFSVWTDATSSSLETKVWPETSDSKCTTDVHRGYYGLLLDGAGSGCGAGFSAELFTGAARYLQVTINGTVMMPRMRLAAVPVATIAHRALLADDAQDAQALGGKPPAFYATADHVHSAENITDFAERAAAAAVAAGVPWDSVEGLTEETVWPGKTPWGALTGKPADFPPSVHTHLLGDLSDVSAAKEWPGTSAWERVTNKPSAFPPSSHQHAASDVNGLPAALADKTIPGALNVSGKVQIGNVEAPTGEQLEVAGRIVGSPVAGRWYVAAKATGNTTVTWGESFNAATDYFALTSDKRGITVAKAGTYLVSGSFYFVDASPGDEVEAYFRVNGNTHTSIHPTGSTDEGATTGSFTDIVRLSGGEVLTMSTVASQGAIHATSTASYLVLTRLN